MNFTWCWPVYSWLLICLLLYFCIAFLKWSDSICFVNFFSQHILLMALMILNLAILSALYLIFHMYPLYFHAFAVTLSDTINSIAGGSLHLSLCSFVSLYLQQKYFLFGWPNNVAKEYRTTTTSTAAAVAAPACWLFSLSFFFLK